MTGRTTLIIAHRLSTISLADRVAVVEDGRVDRGGHAPELLANEPRYVEILAQSRSRRWTNRIRRPTATATDALARRPTTARARGRRRRGRVAPPRRRRRHRHRQPTPYDDRREGSTDGLGRRWRRDVRRRRHGAAARSAAAARQSGQRAAVRGDPVGAAGRGREAARDRARVADTRREVLAPGQRRTGSRCAACSARTGSMLILVSMRPRVVEAVDAPGRTAPHPDRHRQRHHASPNWTVLLACAVGVARLRGPHDRRQRVPGVAHRDACLVADHVRAARARVRASPAPLARLLHRREGGRDHDPHDERRRGARSSCSRKASCSSRCRASRWSSSRSSCSSTACRSRSSRSCSSCPTLTGFSRCGSAARPTAVTTRCATASPEC